ncbi:alcohol dehydrogenase-like 1 [Pyrus ussuriensis x Pyrus communis]|uniref:Alcohol dehydrogenase-like 1 n=1 Tax=Pyrus ussuriensis x Pyrus communis TaxID=2448454 RepID=A0A5N5FYW4_9ROSA|nr:alcohol dehydrogenase-like 1 [Pyrus ussuriensis x Pyrus communis]
MVGASQKLSRKPLGFHQKTGFEKWKLEALGFNGGSLKWCSNDASKDVVVFPMSQRFEIKIYGTSLVGIERNDSGSFSEIKGERVCRGME